MKVMALATAEAVSTCRSCRGDGSTGLFGIFRIMCNECRGTGFCLYPYAALIPSQADAY